MPQHAAHVFDRFSQSALRQRLHTERPLLDLFYDRSRSLVAKFSTHLVTWRSSRTERFDRIELIDQIEDLFGFGGEERLDLNELPAHVTPAVRELSDVNYFFL